MKKETPAQHQSTDQDDRAWTGYNEENKKTAGALGGRTGGGVGPKYAGKEES